jgi:catechol 2,3-dioxygenase-like lactoylglutathione lyase family enzyme
MTIDPVTDQISPGERRPSLNHVALSVRNLERSASWYENVFGIKPQLEETAEGRAAKVLADPAWQLVIALVQHDANQGTMFAEPRTGLDHIGWWVATR